MSRLETIEKQVQELTPKELVAFRRWFAAFDATAWDRDFEADVHAGKLDDLADAALADHEAGKSREL